MSMKKVFLAGAAATLLAGGAMAAEPVKLTNSQMDDVTAGLALNVTLALALTGPLAGINTTQQTLIQQSEVATLDQVQISGASVSSTRQTAAIGVNQLTASSTSGGGIGFGAGTLAVGGSGSVTIP